LLTDLTAFQATGFSAEPIAVSGAGNLSLFSYDTASGAGSLDLVATFSSSHITTVCIGASSTLSPTCNPQGSNPSSTRAVILTDLLDSTSDAPTVTLVSGATVPEPSTWALTLLGFASLGFAGYRSRKRAAVVA
jgi:PEP-CTERM motif